MLLDLGVPSADVWRRLARKQGRLKPTVKALLVGDVVHDQNAHGATVIGGSDSPEALLACAMLVYEQ